MKIISWGLLFSCLTLAPAAGFAADAPVATILGKLVTRAELDPPANIAAPAGNSAMDGEALKTQQRRERLRGLVWSAVFEDYAKQRHVAPTLAEIESHLLHHHRFQQEDKQRRERDRRRLVDELKSPKLTETRRKEAQQHLDTLNRLKEFDAQQEQERRDPAREKMWQESERRVTEFWVRRCIASSAAASFSSRRAGSQSTPTAGFSINTRHVSRS